MAKAPSISLLSADGLTGDMRKIVEQISKPLNDFIGPVATALNKGLTPSQNLDAQWHTFTLEVQDPWIAPTLLHGWDNYDASAFNAAGYRKDSQGLVYLQGLVKDGTVSASIFTLPAGYRPSKEIGFGQAAMDSLGAFTIGDVRVHADGEVWVRTVGTVGAWVFLDGIVFEPVSRTPAPAACWPYYFKCTTRATPKALLLGQVIDKADPIRPVYAASPSWNVQYLDGKRQIRIMDVPGLAPGRVYDVTVLVVGE